MLAEIHEREDKDETGLLLYSEGFTVTGNLQEDITTFFQLHKDWRTLDHTLKVAYEAQRIAKLYKLDPTNVVKAALLHDISNVIPITKMLNIAEELSIKILEEELKYSRSVHQKLSKEMAEEIFRINDYEILSALESHIYWLCDVFIDENYRGKGIGKKLIESIVESDQFKNLLWVLGTRDAHGLYEAYEFVRDPERFMSRMPDFLRNNK